MQRATSTAAPCPCGTDRSYDACCGRCHSGLAAPTAESLMRSRYSAFVLRLEDYLLSTWHPRTRPTSVDVDATTRWLGLSVKSARDTAADAAEVEFVARYRIGGGTAVRLHERSRFVREDGHWYYVDGEVVR
ncbi:MAG: YchJ family protein [Panacagrimonas sp.]